MSVPEPAPSRFPGILMLVGGLAAVGAVFLEWYAPADPQPGEEKLTGLQTLSGLSVLVLGGIIALLGIVHLVRGRGRALAVAGLILGILLTAVGAYTSFLPESAIVKVDSDRIARSNDVSDEELGEFKSFLEEAFDSGLLSIKPGIGAYVALGGGLIALVGGLVGAASRRRAPAALAAYPTAAYPPEGPPPSAPPPAAYPPPEAPQPPQGPPQ
jgi:hypothetical protein